VKDVVAGTPESGGMTGALPSLPFQKKGNGVGGALFDNSVIGNFMVYQGRIEQIYCSYSSTQKLQKVFYDFCYYF